jgi:hypothetical protein
MTGWNKRYKYMKFKREQSTTQNLSNVTTCLVKPISSILHQIFLLVNSITNKE